MARFELGNKDAEKWTEDVVRDYFDKMLANTKDEEQDILSIQDAIASVGLYRSSVDYLVNKFPVFGNLKKDLQDIIIARINKGALKGDYVPTPAIFRMKQLGEIDGQEINHKNNGKDFESSIHVQSKDQAEKVNDLLNQFDDE